MKENLKFVVVGHVDHGKSTLIGRLLYDTNSLPPDKMDEIREASQADSNTTEFAFVMDHLEEERKNRVTIDTAQIFFRTSRREYVIIDAPGHKQFLKNMITGTTLAEAALLLIDAEEGLREQTHRHAYMLSLLGVRQIIVVINKMDLVGFDQGRYNEIESQIRDRLADFDLKPLMVVPISAQLGDNIALVSQNMPWYTHKTLLQGLDDLSPAPDKADAPLRFPLQDVYEQNGDRILVGKVASGTLTVGQDVVFHPLGKSARVRQIKKFGEDPSQAVAGESIGLVLENKLPAGTLQRGQIVAGTDDSPTVTNRLVATVFWMSGEPVMCGDRMELKCATQQIPCKIQKINDRLNSSSLEIIQKDADRLCDTEVARLTLSLDDHLCTDPFESIEEMGRFVLIRDADTVAGGVVH